MKTLENEARTMLTEHEERILSEMDSGLYGSPYGTPFHSLPSCPRGIKREALVRLVEWGYLEGIGPHIFTYTTGEEHVIGYEFVRKVRDPLQERDNEFREAFAYLFPACKVVQCVQSRIGRLIVKGSLIAIGNGSMMFVSIEGTLNADSSMKHQFASTFLRVDKTEKLNPVD